MACGSWPGPDIYSRLARYHNSRRHLKEQPVLYDTDNGPYLVRYCGFACYPCLKEKVDDVILVVGEIWVCITRIT
jgi:hypothetical protein